MSLLLALAPVPHCAKLGKTWHLQPLFLVSEQQSQKERENSKTEYKVPCGALLVSYLT